MYKEIHALIAEFKKNSLPTFCALLVAAVVYLVLMLIKQQKDKDALELSYRQEVVASEKRCNEKTENLLREQLAEMQKASERQTKIEGQIRRLKNGK